MDNLEQFFGVMLLSSGISPEEYDQEGKVSMKYNW